jgi:hypothetical protein
MIYFLNTNYYSKNYVPFQLYRNCISNYISCPIYFREFNKLLDDDILIAFMYDIIYLSKSKPLLNCNNTIFLINTEHYSFKNTINILNKIKDKKNIHLLEYNVLNIHYINNNIKELKYTFLPLLYNPCLKFVNETNFIPFNERKHDVIFCGSYTRKLPYRFKILNKLKEQINIHFIHHGRDIHAYNNELLNSKIVVNVYSYEYTKPFDYYRNTYLLANKCLIVSEYPTHIDLNIEPNLMGFEEHLIYFNQDNMVEVLNKYLKLTNEEYMELVNKQYDWFVKQNNMNEYLKQIL